MLDKIKGIPAWGKWALGCVAVFIAIGLLVPAPEDDDKKAAEKTTTTSSKTPRSAAASPPDTGRMDRGEFVRFVRGDNEFRSEVEEYSEIVGGKCKAIAEANQISELFKCEDDAYDGVLGQYSATNDEWEGFQDDVEKKCLSALTGSVKVLNQFSDLVVTAHDMFAKGQFDAVAAMSEPMALQRKAYERQLRRTRSRCEPR